MGYGESDLHAPYLFRSGCYSYRYRSMRYRGLRDGDHQLRVWIERRGYLGRKYRQI